MVSDTEIALNRLRSTSKRRNVRRDRWVVFLLGGEWGVGRGANFPGDQAAFDNAVQHFRRGLLGKHEAYGQGSSGCSHAINTFRVTHHCMNHSLYLDCSRGIHRVPNQELRCLTR